MRMRFDLLFGASLIFACGCASGGRIQFPTGATEPLFRGLGNHHFRVSTDSPLAQRYFDQGLVMRYAFAFEAARRSFGQAAAIDPECAMAWWGVAWSIGPNFWTDKVSEVNANRALDAIRRAQALQHNASPIESELIAAVARWHAAPPVEDRAALNHAYMNAMAQLWKKYPDNPEVGTLYAQSLVALRPKALFSRDAYKHPTTIRLVEVLQNVLALDPSHPGANHFYVHAVEASPDFRNGQASADRLRTLAPGVPHLLHMSSHIDVLAGSWDEAIEANERANDLTEIYRKALETDIYSPAWTHNYHMLAFACMMGGQYEKGLRAGRRIASAVIDEKIAIRPIDRFRIPILYGVQVRFAKWHDVLAERKPPDGMPFTTLMWHFARAVALAALGELDAAEEERIAFHKAYEVLKELQKELRRRIEMAYELADLVMLGEFAFHRGDKDEAIRILRRAVEYEDGIKYFEPPLWHQPARHSLGAVLVTARRFGEAEAVYREDLKRWPNNGWSLHGLETCLRARAVHDEAEQIQARFAKVWKNADTKIAASCLCVLRGAVRQ